MVLDPQGPDLIAGGRRSGGAGRRPVRNEVGRHRLRLGRIKGRGAPWSNYSCPFRHACAGIQGAAPAPLGRLPFGNGTTNEASMAEAVVPFAGLLEQQVRCAPREAKRVVPPFGGRPAEPSALYCWFHKLIPTYFRSVLHLFPITATNPCISYPQKFSHMYFRWAFCYAPPRPKTQDPRTTHV